MSSYLAPERLSAAGRTATAAASDRGLIVTVAVVDGEGVLSHLRRMVGARALSVDLSVRKAVTAARTGRATHEWARMLGEDPALARAVTASLPDVVLFGGGIPIRMAGAVIGAIGVSGASQDEDQLLAELAADALLHPLEEEEVSEND